MNGTFWTTVMHTFEGFRHDFAQNTPMILPPEYRLVIALKQIFQLESIPCIHSNHVFNCLFGNVCLDVTYMRFITIFCISSHF